MPDIVPIPVENPLMMAWLDTNDLGNAERLVRLARGRLVWVDELGWVSYDDRRWSARDGDTQARRLAHEVARHIDLEARALNEIAEDANALEEAFGWALSPEIAKERVTALRKHAVKSGDAGRTRAMLEQARTDLRVRLDEFDTDPFAYNVINGTIRFKSNAEGKWRAYFSPHDPADRFMQIADVEFDPDATCPKWQAHMELVQPDLEQRDVRQVLYGYTLLGVVSDQAFYVDQGKGGDGKSTTNDVIFGLHGDYARRAGISTFLKGPVQGGSQHRSDLVRLQGDIRFVVADEPPDRSTWDGAVIKQLTGSQITARGMNEKTEITYSPHWKLFVEVNALPNPPGDDDGFRRRFRLFVWPLQLYKSPNRRPQEVVEAELAEERSGILNWMIAGAIDFLVTRTIPEPAIMTEALANYWASSSPIGEWLTERCDLSDPDQTTGATYLYEDFKRWCEGNGIEKVMTQTAFGRKMTERHIMSVPDSAGRKVRRGIRLLSATPAPPYKGSSGPQPSGNYDPDDVVPL